MCGVVMLVCVCVLQPRGLPAWTSRAPPIVGPRSRVFNVELHGQLASHTQAPVWLGPRCLSSLAAQVRGSDYETRVRLGQCHSDRSSHVFLKVIRSEAFVERPLTDLPHERCDGQGTRRSPSPCILDVIKDIVVKIQCVRKQGPAFQQK